MTHVTLLSTLALVVASLSAQAQVWPSKPVRVIVPVGAGSTTDIIPRAVFEYLGPQLGQPVVVENRLGAGGTIGTGFVAKADPDGYTVLAHGSALTIAPSLYPNLTFHPARDFAAVVPLGVSPVVLVVSAARGFKTVGDFVAAAKAKPGTFNFSSVGVGSATHLSAERFRFSAGLDVVHVPMKGGAEAMFEVIAGRVDFFFGPVGLVLPHVRSGELNALVVNSVQRSAALPDVPTTLEAGFSNAEYPIWFGLFVPVKTPREVVDKLHGATIKALQTQKLRDKLAALGLDPMPMTPREFDELVVREISLNAALIKTIGLKPE